MGSHDISTSWDGTLTQDQVKKKFAQLLIDDRYEHGHEGYSGSWGTLHGITFSGKTFPDENSARRYCLDNTNKWDNAMAVKYTHVTRTVTKQPTFKGKTQPIGYGMVVHTTEYENGTARLVFADQMTDEERDTYRALLIAYQDATKEKQRLGARLDALIRAIQNTLAPIDYAEVESVRQAAHAAFLAASQCDATREAYRIQLVARLYAHSESSEPRWLIAGWAAS